MDAATSAAAGDVSERKMPKPAVADAEAEEARMISLPPGFRKLSRRETPPSCAGVYVICRGKEIIYIGRSKRLKMRLSTHLVCRLRGFTTYVLETSKGKRIESRLISVYKPVLNRTNGEGNLQRYGGLKRLKKFAMDPNYPLHIIGRYFRVEDQTVLNWLNKYNLKRRYARKKRAA